MGMSDEEVEADYQRRQQAREQAVEARRAAERLKGAEQARRWRGEKK